ncbi:MAG: PEP-CTERM sorting domain-containing protein [Deltaproteobacteria bacterium]|nr:PEP-CTERM sorting domain-containing protein [Deltaproteobacteria bacterium]MBW2447443.1 PEP-CTERM sorting domain-containing protein [Deltaproteobacteria bacterium]
MRLVLGLALTFLGGSANAATLVATLSDMGGDVEFQITFDDAAVGAGEIQVTVEVTLGEADLRGLFLDIADDSLLSGLSAVGADVTNTIFAASSVIDLGQGANVQGDGPCPCDIGVAFGSPGMGRDDIQTTTFVLSHATESLTLALFAEQTVMVRATSVGDELAREASAKTAGTTSVLVPEPSALALLLPGALVIGARRRRAAA